MTDFGETFQAFRQILCICPSCSHLHHLSDIRIKSDKTPAKTWLDEFKEKWDLQKEVQIKFDKEKVELKAKFALEGRKEADKLFQKAISPDIKKLNFDPHDIKPISNPVDFLVFKGMDKNVKIKKDIDDIIFFSKKSKNKELIEARKQVKKAIAKNEYHWNVARVTDDGQITLGDK